MKSTLLSVMFVCMLLSLNALADVLPQKIETQLNIQLQDNAERYNHVAQSVLVLKNSKPIYRGMNGVASIELSVPIATNAQFPVYSIAKLFASVTLMQLVEQNRIDLAAAIGTYLPSLPKHWQNISVNHFLNHTSGIPEYFSNDYVNIGFPLDKATIFAKLGKAGFAFKTGDTYAYNNTNYLVIAALVESISNKTYLDMVTKTVIEPLGLTNTFFAQASSVIPKVVNSYWGNKGNVIKDNGINWPQYTFSHSALYSTVDDIARFMTGVVQGKLLTAKTLKKMWQPMRLNNGKPGGYASGWEYSANDKFIQVGHEGGNRVRLSYFFNPIQPTQNYTTVYFTSGNGYDGWTSHLTTNLMATISPTDFPFSHITQQVLQSAFSPKSEHLLSELAKGFTDNHYIQNFGMEKFVRYRGYNLYYSAAPKYSIPVLKLYTQLYPASAPGWKRLAHGFDAAGNRQKALSILQKALDLNPQLDGAQQFMTELLAKKG